MQIGILSEETNFKFATGINKSELFNQTRYLEEVSSQKVGTEHTSQVLA